MAHRVRKSAVPALIAAALGLLAVAPLAGAATLQSARGGDQLSAFQQSLKASASAPVQSASGHGLGLRPEPMDPPTSGASAGSDRLGILGILPASYDLRTEGRLTPVRDQGIYGTCWAFASLASAESVLMPTAFDFSEDNMALTAGFDNGGDPYNSGGNYYMATAYLTRWGGPVNETDDAYGDGTTPAGLSAAKHVQEVLYVAGASTPTDNSAIKEKIMSHGAVATSIHMDDVNYYDDADNCYYYNGAESTDHAVAIVGWDDSFDASAFIDTPAGDGAWLVRNSWGTGWGDGGYFWISYYDVHCGRSTVFNAVYSRTESPANFTSIYYHDPYGQVDTLGYYDYETEPPTVQETAWGANVYKASRSQTINGIGFFTHMPDTTYSVYTAGVAADGTPGTLALQGSGEIDTAGFHTVKFTGSRWVTAGSKFAVVIRMTVPIYGSPLAYEAPVVGFDSAASAAPMQSYVRSSSAYEWDDLTSFGGFESANLCLKAYGTDDKVRPSTSTYAKSVKRYATATLKYKVKDALPSCGAATCSIQIIKSNKVVKTISLGSKATNVTLSYRYKASLAKGTYYWRVTAKDRAGNTATSRAQTKLVIY